MNEKIYKRLGRIGGFNIALGVIILSVAIPVGILSIVNGARMLGLKKYIMI